MKYETSGFALIDITRGRASMTRRVDRKNKERVPIILIGDMSSQWGKDDGTSIEFEIDVKKMWTPDKGVLAPGTRVNVGPSLRSNPQWRDWRGYVLKAIIYWTRTGLTVSYETVDAWPRRNGDTIFHWNWNEIEQAD